MGKKRENPYTRFLVGGGTKFKGVVHIREKYYIYSSVLTLREAYAWTENKVKELEREFINAYVQSWEETKL